MKSRAPLLLLLAIASFSCGTEPIREPALYVVTVDSLVHPISVSLGDTVTLRFFGTIGPDGCHHFSSIEVDMEPLQVNLTVWGAYSNEGACPQVVVYLNGAPWRFVAFQTGWFLINIHQPDGGALRDLLMVL